ncbi:endonuclease/exonuclease/phosphatase family protein [Pontibacter sp. 13R65]|uniref:endonuclease/exonuclease/phosphatase family protein n=1 Tax=Pontibacter sp. 13R65 TaxID=3127458 RepID=UPI00301CCA2C
MKQTLLIAGSILTLFSFLPLINSPLWWIRVLDFPRVHVALFLTITTVLFLVCYGVSNTPEIVLVALWGVAILNEARYIFPFTPLASIEALKSEEKQPRHSFNIMIANVRMTNTKYQKFLDLVLANDPDIVVINEPNAAWHDYMQKDLETKYAYSIKKPLENTYGMMLYSKLKLHDSEVRYLVEDSIPSFYTVVELPGGPKFDFFTVHPQPPRLMKNTETREAELLIVAKQAKATSYPSIVAGDLNDVAWSGTTKLFKNISGMLDPRVGRGFYNTYNAFIPLFRYPLDHIFYDPTFRLIDLKRLSKFGSDHFPILITLNYEPQEEAEQEHPVAAPEEHEEASELIKEGLEKGEELNQEKSDPDKT